MSANYIDINKSVKELLRVIKPNIQKKTHNQTTAGHHEVELHFLDE